MILFSKWLDELENRDTESGVKVIKEELEQFVQDKFLEELKRKELEGKIAKSVELARVNIKNKLALRIAEHYNKASKAK